MRVTTMTALDWLRQREVITSEDALPIQLQMSRNDLPILCRDLGFTKGAEIGVWKGAFAAQFCTANRAMHMLCVDPWSSYPAWKDTKNEMPLPEAKLFMAAAYRDARNRLEPLNTTIVRNHSKYAVKDVPDGSLDLVYIDGNHVYDAVTQDVTLWAPKVRSGGILAGHDFRDFANKPTIHVKQAVLDYTSKHGIDPWFITAADRTPSFLWVVP
jgi:hypothetical protein